MYALIIDRACDAVSETIKPLIDQLTYAAQAGPFAEAVIKDVAPDLAWCGHKAWGLTATTRDEHAKHKCAVMDCRNYVGKSGVIKIPTLSS